MSEHRLSDDSSVPDNERSSLIEQLLLTHIQQRLQGEDVDDDELAAQHPELMPELAERLRLFSEMAALRAAHETMERAGSGEDTGLLSVRCPHCRELLRIPADASLVDITCSSCGSRFCLADENAAQTPTATLAKQLGHFELIEQLGFGSFGTVWKGRDTELDRFVAVKIPRRDQLAPQDLTQFLREARAAAQLNHPNIVSVHEVGRDNETVFIVSDLVAGVSLSDWLTQRQPTIRETCTLCATIADALQHAHEAGVIHRDLKPQNIMVDEDGAPHLLDFGLARRHTGEVTVTLDGHVLGTPAYMPPEQARGTAHEVGCEADIYSLGVILFELLTGELPFRGNARMLIHQVLHEDAPSPRTLNSSVPKDLETICLKCLEKEPEQRYGTAKQVADELRRFLRGEAIHARPISPTGRAVRWCRRNPVAAALVLALVALAVGGPILAVTQQRLRRAADGKAEEARTAAASEAAARANTRRLLYVSDMNAAVQAWETANIPRTLRLLNRHRPEPDQVDLRGFEWYYVWRLCHMGLTTQSIKHSEPVAAVAFSPDGSKVATGSGNTVRLWNARTRTLEHACHPHEDVVTCVAFSPNGKVLATGSADKTIRLWDVDTRKSEHVLEHRRGIVGLSFSQTGVLASSDGTVRLWDVSTGHPVDEFEGNSSAFSVAISPTDGKTMATSDSAGTITFWDIGTRQIDIKAGSAGHGTCVTFSPDGATAATADCDSLVRLWDVATHAQLAVLSGHTGPVMSVVFSPDGKRLATASVDGTVRLWDVGNRKCTRILRGHIGSVRIVAFSPDGKSLASGGLDGTLKLWNVTSNLENLNTFTGHSGIVKQVSLSPDARTLASVSHDSTWLWDLESRAAEEIPLMRTPHEYDIEFAPKGDVLALADNVHVRIWSVASKSDVTTLPGANCVAFSPSSNLLATGSRQEDRVTLWDTDTWQTVATIPDYRGLGWAGNGLAFSPNGDLLAISGPDYTVSLWDISEHPTIPPLRARLVGHTDMIVCLAFSPDGQSLATGSFDGTVKLWDVETHKAHTLGGSLDEVWSLAFTQDGKTLATCSDNAIRLWNLATMEQAANLTGHTSKVSCVTFSVDGTALISGSFDTTIKIWEASSEEDVLNADWINNIQLPRKSMRRFAPFGI